MASNNITGTQTANWTPELWETDTLDAAEFAEVLIKLVNTDYEGTISEKGDTVHIPHVNNYTPKTKTQGIGSPIEFEAMVAGVTDLVVDTHEYAAFEVERFAEKQALPGYRAKQTKKLGYALTRGMEVALASLIPNLTTPIGSYGTELTDRDFQDAWEKLALVGAITEGAVNSDVACVLSAQAYSAALRTDRFINADYAGAAAGGNALERAAIGTVYGSKVYMSLLLNSPSAGQHACTMFHRQVLAIARQQRPEVLSDFIIEQIATAVVAHQIYGKGRITRPVETPGSVTANDSWGVLLKTI